MFTPPPSPFPSPKDSSNSSTSEDKETTTTKKARFGRRTKWTAVLIPFVLALTTLSTHYFTHPAIFDFFTTDPGKIEWNSIGSLHKRHPDSSSSTTSFIADSSSTPTPTSTASSSASGTASATTTLAATAQPIPTIPSTAPTLPTPFPQPWDSDISLNFSTDNCYTFFQSMLNNQSFRSCRPFSLLLQSSNEFFQAESNLTLMNELVWGTCNTTLGQDQCTSNMANFATQLKEECAEDLSDGNANAVQALIGLQTFSVMATTACLSDPTTNTYCFLNAIHNTNPSDLYYYSLPLGISVPSTSTPTCSACTKNLLGVYLSALQSSSSSNSSSTSTAGTSTLSALASVYPQAEQLAVGACGGGYATAVASAEQSNSNGAGRSRGVIGGILLSGCISVVVGVVMAFGWS